MTLEITTPRLLIREWLVQDAELLFPLSQDAAMGGSHHGQFTQASLEDAEKKIIEWALLFGQTKMGILPIFLKHQGPKKQPTLIGLCGIKPLMLGKMLGKNGLHFEIICRIATPFSKQGYASEAIPEMMDYAFKKLGLKEVVGVSQSEHPGTQRVLEKSGMSFLKSVSLQNKKLDIFSVSSQ